MNLQFKRQQTGSPQRMPRPCRAVRLLAALVGVSLFWVLSAPEVCAQAVQANKSKNEVEIVTLTRRGFQPAKVTRRPGPFVLSLHNITKLPLVEFTLSDASSQAVKSSAKLGATVGHSFSDVIDLGIGTYSLQVKQLPGRVMTITITANGK